jgi:hypothetical protein
MLIALLMSSVLSMSLHAEPAAPPPEEKSPAPALAQPAAQPVADAAPKITMISNGEEPRALARLALKPGEVQSIVMDMDMQMKMAMEGVANPTPQMPTFGINVRITVEEALPEGWWKYKCEFTSLDVKATDKSPAEMVAMMKSVMSEMVGMKIGAEINTFGHQRNFEVVSKITNPMLLQQLESLKQSLAQVALTLPEPEIGVGAKWEVDSIAMLGGVSSRQNATYRLLSRDGDTIKLGVSMKQTPAEKNSPIRNLPEGVTGTLIDLAGDSKGELVYDLTRIMVKQGQMSGESVVNMNVEGQGMKAKIDTQTTIVMTVRPATPADETSAQPKP